MRELWEGREMKEMCVNCGRWGDEGDVRALCGGGEMKQMCVHCGKETVVIF